MMAEFEPGGLDLERFPRDKAGTPGGEPAFARLVITREKCSVMTSCRTASPRNSSR